MTIIARRIRATPERSAADAWQIIVNLASKPSSEARRELESISGIASSIIASDVPRDAPMVLRGQGPRVRFYCLYDEDAIAGESANEVSLPVCPTDDEWTMSLPADIDDVEWIKAALEKKTARVTVREKNEPMGEKSDVEAVKVSASAAIDMEAFLRP